MGGPKPTLGYPSRTAAVVALRQEGLDSQEIAHRIGISTATVAALEHSATRSQGRKNQTAEANGRTVLLSLDAIERLRPHASKRGITANELARRIVDVVTDDGMVDAVLDDKEGAE